MTTPALVIRRPIGYTDRLTSDKRYIAGLRLPGRPVPVHAGGVRVGEATVEVLRRTVWATIALDRGVRPEGTPVLDLDVPRDKVRPRVDRFLRITCVDVSGTLIGVTFTDAPAWPFLASVEDQVQS